MVPLQPSRISALLEQCYNPVFENLSCSVTGSLYNSLKCFVYPCYILA